jgi:CubicO group peptidase (beta-lactamase class C family)
MLLGMLVGCSANESSEDIAARIAQVERQIVPRVVIRGEPIPDLSLADRMAHHGVPGVSVAVINGGEIEWAKGYGVADVASGTSITEHTLFQAASISKPVAATAALSLVERGMLELDGDVNQWLREWRVPESRYTAEQPVTLRRLVTHTAGLTVSGFPGYAADEPVPSTVEVLDGGGNTDPILPDTAPGSLWRYSGGGYTVMQLLLTDVTALPFPDLMRDLVLEPVGMNASGYEQPLPEARRSLAATGYRSNGTEVDGKWHTYPEMAAAGLWTTPSDLAHWAMNIQRAYAGAADAVLSPEMAARMLQPDQNNWGLGPAIGDDGLTFRHGGSNEGFRCALVAFIEGGKGAVVMTNSDNGGDLMQEVLLTIARAYDWPIMKPLEKEVIQLNPAVLAEITGRYALPEEGVVTIEAGDNSLVAMMPDGERYVLLPESTTQFFNRDDGTRVTFVRDGERVVALEVEGMRVERVK